MTRSLPPVVVTSSRLLREQVSIAERHCGLDFDYYDTIPDARRYAIRREAVILGGDLITRTRKPWHCRGVVLAANIGPWTNHMTTYAERAGARNVIDLPTGLPAFIEAIWQAHRNLHTQLHRWKARQIGANERRTAPCRGAGHSQYLRMCRRTPGRAHTHTTSACGLLAGRPPGADD